MPMKSGRTGSSNLFPHFFYLLGIHTQRRGHSTLSHRVAGMKNDIQKQKSWMTQYFGDSLWGGCGTNSVRFLKGMKQLDSRTCLL